LHYFWGLTPETSLVKSLSIEGCRKKISIWDDFVNLNKKTPFTIKELAGPKYTP